MVIALGSNALLRQGQPLDPYSQRRNVRIAAEQIAPVATDNELVIVHGSGPQPGLLAVQTAASGKRRRPIDELSGGADSIIGYMIEQELGNLLPADTAVATLLTQVEVDLRDPAFRRPTKLVGPIYTAAQAANLERKFGWQTAFDGNAFRRVVASPRPSRILGLRPIECLLANGTIVICTGSGGIPTASDTQGRRQGVEAVIDKDICSGLLATCLKADLLVIATDVDAVYADWGSPRLRALSQAHPEALEKLSFADGSMGPKVKAACEFARKTGSRAVIGSLADIEAIVSGTAGTQISTTFRGIQYRNPGPPAPSVRGSLHPR